MKIVVTGAAGFIGSHIAETLAQSGAEVVGIDCFTPYYALSVKQRTARELNAVGVEVVDRDLSKEPLDTVLRGAEAIIHLAAQPGISRTTPFDDYLTNNVVATERLVAAACELSSLRAFLNISTSSVYGRHATEDEEAAPKPTSWYGVTKLAAEQLVLAACREKGLPACSLRLFSVYGPRERPEKLYHKLITSILHEKEFPLFSGSEHHSRSFTYVGDIVDGVLAALHSMSIVEGEIINLGCDTEITTGRGIEIVEQILGRKAKIKIVSKRPGDQLRTVANIVKAQKLLDYYPRVQPEEGLALQVAWLREHISLSQAA